MFSVKTVIFGTQGMLPWVANQQHQFYFADAACKVTPQIHIFCFIIHNIWVTSTCPFTWVDLFVHYDLFIQLKTNASTSHTLRWILRYLPKPFWNLTMDFEIVAQSLLTYYNGFWNICLNPPQNSLISFETAAPKAQAVFPDMQFWSCFFYLDKVHTAEVKVGDLGVDMLTGNSSKRWQPQVCADG